MQQKCLLYWTSIFALIATSIESSPSSGCRKSISNNFSPDKTTTVKLRKTNDQPVRYYNVHLPVNYKNDREHPIVFSFHGHRRNMYLQEDLSQLSEKGLLINGSEIIAVYPQGVKGTDGGTAWQGAPYSNPYIDDISFVHKMISDLENTFCIDSSRIYATGKSNGAGFVNLLACTPSIAAKFAAFATVSAAFYTTTFNNDCPTTRAIPILNFHGTTDSVTRYNGGKTHGSALVDIDTFRRTWALRNGCVDQPTISNLSKNIDKKGTVEIQIWNKNCKTNGIVIGYKITKGQHSWPRTTLLSRCNRKLRNNDCSLTVFNATSNVIIPFFNKFSL